MHTHQKASDAVAVIGVDIGKNTFQDSDTIVRLSGKKATAQTSRAFERP